MQTSVTTLARHSLIYGIGGIVGRGIPFFLLPIYTQYLTPADYGRVAVFNLVVSLLGVLLPLALHGALTPLYFDKDTWRRNEDLGTIWVTIAINAFVICFTLDRLGPYLTHVLFQQVPFEPYLRLALWTAFFSIFSLTPLTLFQLQGRPQWYMLVNSGVALLTSLAILWATVGLHLGALGYLWATFLVTSGLSVFFVFITLRTIKPAFHRATLQRALQYSLPLIPHAVAGWVLELADRAILERYIPLDALGLYAIGYQLGSLMSVVASAVNQAWVPLLFRQVSERGNDAKPILSRLVTYMTCAIVWVGLTLTMLSRWTITVFTASEYHSAHSIVFWVLLGQILNALYYIPVGFLFLKERTALVPIATSISAGVNIGLNLWLVPTYGSLAAAWSTCIAYGVLLAITAVVAQHHYAFPYESQRLFKLVGIAAAWWGTGLLINFASPWAEAILRGIWCITLPLWLALGRFWNTQEIQFAFAWGRRWFNRSAA